MGRNRAIILLSSAAVVVIAAACGHRATPGAEVNATPRAAGADSGGDASAATGDAAPALDGVVTRSPPPSMPLAQFLGRPRPIVEGLLGAREGSTDSGWVAYGDSWALLYEGGCAVELRARIEPGAECAEAAALLGFGDAGVPLRRASSCEWPGLSERHVLGPGLAGALDLRTGIFHARRVGGARRCDQPPPAAPPPGGDQPCPAEDLTRNFAP